MKRLRYQRWFFIATLVAICSKAFAATAERLDDFKLKGFGSHQFTTESLHGRVTVMNFWFPACAPCVAELPDLNRIVSDNHRNPVSFVAVTFAGQPEVDKFLLSHAFNFVLVAPDGDPGRFFPGGKIGFPMNIVLDKRGRVIYRHIGSGPESTKELSKAIAVALQHAN